MTQETPMTNKTERLRPPSGWQQAATEVTRGKTRWGADGSYVSGAEAMFKALLPYLAAAPSAPTVGDSAGAAILQGLHEAAAYARGENIGAVEHRVHVQPAPDAPGVEREAVRRILLNVAQRGNNDTLRQRDARISNATDAILRLLPPAAGAVDHLGAAVDAIQAAEGALARARKDHPEVGVSAIRAVIEVEAQNLRQSRGHVMAARAALGPGGEGVDRG